MHQPRTAAAAAAPINQGRTAFTDAERRLLLGSPGIGPGVISRLEALGYTSLGDLRQAGVDTVVARVCSGINTSAWANRKRALEKVLTQDPLLRHACL